MRTCYGERTKMQHISGLHDKILLNIEVIDELKISDFENPFFILYYFISHDHLSTPIAKDY